MGEAGLARGLDLEPAIHPAIHPAMEREFVTPELGFLITDTGMMTVQQQQYLHLYLP